ncbi:MAG: amidohydrolase family protein, partial [Bacteroidota bacterium]
FLFGKTAPVRSLSGKVPIAMGTDSTLTGNATLFEELRTAQEESLLSAMKLFTLVTESPRTIFRLPPDAGTLRQGGKADLFLLRAEMENAFETLLTANPGDISLLMRDGRVVFHEPSIFPKLTNSGVGAPVRLNGRMKSVQSPRFSKIYEELKPFLHHYTYLNSD